MRYIPALCLIAAAIVTIPIVGSGLNDQESQRSPPDRVTVIIKNQLQPTIAQLEARAAKAEHEANSEAGVSLQFRSQWI